jgi:WD40 repeat protein
MLVLKGTGGRIRALAFSPDGRLLASAAGRGRRITLWDLAGGAKKRLCGHSAPVRRLVFAPCGDQLASLDIHGHVRLWGATTGESLGPVVEYGAYLTYNLAFAPDGKALATFGMYYDGRGDQIIVWDLSSCQALTSLPPSRELISPCMGFAPDGRTLATGGYNGRVQLWDLAGNRMIATLPQRRKFINHLAFSPDGRILAVALGWTAVLWDVARAEELRRLLGKHAGTVWSVAFTPDGQTLMTGSTDGTVKLWDVATGRERAAFAWDIGRVHVVAFAPDGLRAAAGGESDIVIWDVEG